jgi:hypothetical protein
MKQISLPITADQETSARSRLTQRGKGQLRIRVKAGGEILPTSWPVRGSIRMRQSPFVVGYEVWGW